MDFPRSLLSSPPAAHRSRKLFDLPYLFCSFFCADSCRTLQASWITLRLALMSRRRMLVCVSISSRWLSVMCCGMCPLFSVDRCVWVAIEPCLLNWRRVAGAVER